jgi:hypothetical protein
VFGVELLLDGGEEAVEVDVEKAEPVGLGGVGHADVGHYIRHLFACRASCSRPSLLPVAFFRKSFALAVFRRFAQAGIS